MGGRSFTGKILISYLTANRMSVKSANEHLKDDADKMY